MDSTVVVLFILAVVCIFLFYFFARNPDKSEKAADYLTLNKNPKLFTGLQKKHIERQKEVLTAHANKIATIEEHKIILKHLPERLTNIRLSERTDEETRIVVSTTAKKEAERQQEFIPAAQESNLPLDIYLAGRTIEEQNRLEIDKQKQLAKNASDIKVQEHRSMNQADLDKYQKETEIDLKAMLAMKLLTHESVISITNRLQELIIKRENILKSAYSEETKQKLLGNQDEVIEAFQENLRDQMERYLLKKGDGKNVEGADTETDSPSGD